MSLIKHLRNYTIGTMLGAIVTFFIVIVTGTTYFFQYSELKHNFEQNLNSKAVAILNLATVLLDNRNSKFFSGESQEIPQIIQNEVMNKFTEVSKGEVFFKEASNEPQNPNNKALAFETELIAEFQKNKATKELSRNISIDNKDYFVLARPIIAEEKCKMCHPTWAAGDAIAIADVRIDLENYKKDLNTNLFLMLGNMLATIIVLAIMIQIVFKKELVDRIHKLFDVIVKVENGKFDIDDELKNENMVDGSSKNEIDKLFRHTARMAHSLKPVINSVVTQSKNVVFNSSYATNKVMENNIEYELQNKQISTSKELVDGIASLNEGLKTKLEELLAESANTIKDIGETRKVVIENTKETQTAKITLQESIEAVNLLQEKSADIHRAVEVIAEIADETNLIALNAAIEAARAGEHGRSFSVVAEKIRELAEISLNNADNIGSIVKMMQDGIKDVVKKSSNTNKTFEKLQESAKNIDQSFNTTQDVLNKTVDILNNFGDGFEQQSSSLDNIHNCLNDVFEQSKKVSKNSMEVEKSIYTIMQESAKLNSLSQGFEVVLNKRNAERVIVQAPIRSTIDTASGKIEVHAFDKSEHGISFFGNSKALSALNIGSKIKLTMHNKNGAQTLNIEIAHKNDTSIDDIMLVGCSF